MGERGRCAGLLESGGSTSSGGIGLRERRRGECCCCCGRVCSKVRIGVGLCSGSRRRRPGGICRISSKIEDLDVLTRGILLDRGMDCAPRLETGGREGSKLIIVDKAFPLLARGCRDCKLICRRIMWQRRSRPTITPTRNPTPTQLSEGITAGTCRSRIPRFPPLLLRRGRR